MAGWSGPSAFAEGRQARPWQLLASQRPATLQSCSQCARNIVATAGRSACRQRCNRCTLARQGQGDGVARVALLLDGVLGRTLSALRWLAIPISLMLFLQWP